MQFNPDRNKQTQKIIFSRITLKPVYPSIHFNDAPVTKGNVSKHLGLFLDEKLNFIHQIKEKLAKAMKEINVIRKLKVTSTTKLFFVYKVAPTLMSNLSIFLFEEKIMFHRF